MSSILTRLSRGSQQWTPLMDAGLIDWFEARNLTDGLVSSWESLAKVAGVVSEATNPPVASGGVVSFDGSNDKLERLEGPAKLLGTQTLPGAAGGQANGFICTGLTRAPDGTWWIGNAGDNTTTGFCSLVHVSADFATKLAEIDVAALIPSIISLQGVVYDTSDDTLWFVDYTNKYVRHITLDGTLITADQIGPLAYQPNGLAYDPANNRLIVAPATSGATGTINWYDAEAGSTTTVATQDIGSDATPFDQLFYDAEEQILYMSGGANDAPGGVMAIRPGETRHEWLFSLDEADTIEGFFIDKATRTLYTVNDGAFHQSQAGLNRAVWYQIPQVSGQKIAIWAVTSLGTVSSTKCIFTNGDSNNHPGFGVYPAVSGNITIVANSKDTTGTGRVVVSCTGLPALNTKRLIYAELDLTGTKTVKLWIDGVLYTTADASEFAFDSYTQLANSRIGNGLDGVSRYLSMGLTALGWGFNLNRQKIEQYAAKNYGVTLA